MSATLTEQRLHEGGINITTASASCASMELDGNSTEVFHHYGGGGGGGGVSEIEEESLSSSSTEIREDRRRHGEMVAIEEEEEEECVYVGVGKSETSMGALSWTLNHLIASPSTIVYLIHVFPELKLIPNPLGVGMVPKSQVSAEQIESYMAQERGKRRELLHKFIQLCSASKVKVDTILIESDMVAKAILDLVPILNIRKLVIGINKSNLRKSRSRKGNGIADQILQNAPESCSVRIISEGKEVNEQMMTMTSPSPLTPSPRANASNDHHDSTMAMKEEDHQKNGSVSCSCFIPKFK